MKSAQRTSLLGGAGALTLVLVVAMPAARLAAQSSAANIQNMPMPQNQPTQGIPPIGSSHHGDDDEATIHMEQERARLEANDRQKHLLEDTARLVQLSSQLQAEVEKSGTVSYTHLLRLLLCRGIAELLQHGLPGMGRGRLPQQQRLQLRFGRRRW